MKVSDEDVNFTKNLDVLKEDYIKALNELSLEPVKIRAINEETLDKLQYRIEELERMVKAKKEAQLGIERFKKKNR